MQSTSRQIRAVDLLYPAIAPFDAQMMDVGDGHQIYVEQSGNPNGTPVLVLHGGPGGGTSPFMRRYFDPDRFRIVMFDQRGCGKSLPHSNLEANTTWHLLRDIEQIRDALSIQRWHLFGGSWGSTLALVYAQNHRPHVGQAVLRGVFLLTRDELDWFYGGGAARFWPDLWEQFVRPIPEDERDDLIGAYHRRLFCGDYSTELRFARSWSIWENALATVDSTGITGVGTTAEMHAFARIECAYFNALGWLEPNDRILDRMDKIADMQATIVQGRMDMICPPEAAFQLANAWPAARMNVVPGSGHAMTEPRITDALLRAVHNLPDLPQ